MRMRGRNRLGLLFEPLLSRHDIIVTGHRFHVVALRNIVIVLRDLLDELFEWLVGGGVISGRIVIGIGRRGSTGDWVLGFTASTL